MSAFDLLFLALGLVALVTLVTAGVLASSGRLGQAGRLLRRLAIGAVLYFAIVVAVSVVSPRREYRVGEPQRSDDWCLTVLGARRLEGPGGPLEVSLELENRSRGTPMGERGTVAYLTDSQGRRFDPEPDPAAIPFDRRLQPGERVATTRRFRVPPDATGLGFVHAHEGGFPIGWLVIGGGGWFARPPIVELD